MNRLKRYWKKILIGFVIVLALAAVYIFWPINEDLSYLKNRAANYDVTILRDTYGVPHIFGHTDADAAYGMAYAHSEDDFLTIQQVLLAARGDLATVFGLDSAPADYLVEFLRIWDTVDSQYNTLSPDTRAVVEAYADGLNVYAAHHPDETLPGLFPVRGKDIIAASVEKVPLFFGLDSTIGHLFGDNPEPVPTPTRVSYNWLYGMKAFTAEPATTSKNLFSANSIVKIPQPTKQIIYNSNAFAIGPSRTSGGGTYLDVNAHQPYIGPVAWYEAHIHSDEGWDMVGGTFPASPVILHGHNRDLGWAMTVNHPDVVDVYRLTINPDNPNQYLFDGEWLDLEERDAKLEIKLIGNLQITVKREALWSTYGPAVRTEGHTYAIRYANINQVGLMEQFYRMNKASSFEEWQDAMRMQEIPVFNAVYADKEGTIYYLYNGSIPIRDPNYDWTNYLPGDTSKTLWTEYLPFDDLPQVLNPPSGFVQNANGTPFRTTLGVGNPDPSLYSLTLGIDTDISNRSLRMLELFGNDESITPEEFAQYKFDMKYSQGSAIARFVDMISDAEMPTPDTARAQEVVRDWDLSTDPDNTNAALILYTLNILNDKYPDAIHVDRLVQTNINETMLIDAFIEAVNTLNEKFGRIDMPWGDINRLMRGDVDLPIGGSPDILHATYGEIQDDGRIKITGGDSYVML
ncbi:MAG TPA: penicillin acylase family protein, partial [Anaerolineales bacterium]|nr:penicillin acylase family protein [Anaerolineales bacterium]